MKDEIEKMRNDTAGCTEKCRIRTKLSECELERNQALVRELMKFEWCPECSKLEAGAVSNQCKNNCGRQLMAKCVPLMKNYGRQ